MRELSPLDKRRLDRPWNGECFRVAGMFEYDSGVGHCLNKEAPDRP